MRHWRADRLHPGATSLSASRRSDLPALYSPWLERRFAEGFAEYRVRGRVFRASLEPEDVTHVTFWTKWPAPASKLVEDLRARGWPVLFNVTITGLGGTDVEPHVPAWERAVEAVARLAGLGVPPAAILWRYDPIFLSERFDEDHHVETFTRLAERLRGRVDRVTVSFVEPYPRQVVPDLRRWETETGDRADPVSLERQAALVGRLHHLAGEAGIPFTTCCAPALRELLGCAPAGCNDFEWARRVYPELGGRRRLRARPTRPDCACREERDLGRYDTCFLGCAYCYATRNREAALRYREKHEPRAPSL